MEETMQKGHPKGLYLLFVTEMWERFSYYGMRAILMLFMTKALLFDSEFASGLYGNYTGLVYLTPLIGGYISDRYWGNRKSIFVGGIIMAIGQFLLFFSASSLGTPMASLLFYFGLLSLIVGNGFFKPNISTMVNQLYAPGDKRVDGAFSIFYMGINLGAFLSPLVCGTLAEKIDYRWGFLAAGIGMLIGVVVFELLKNKYIVSSEGKMVGVKPEPHVGDTAKAEEGEKATPSNPLIRIGLWLSVYAVLWLVFMQVVGFNFVSTLIFATSIAASGFVITDPSLTKIERSRIIVIYIIAFFVIFFWSAFEQAGASLTLFADQQTDRTLFGWEMPASYFQSVNPLAIIIFAPLFAVLWGYLGKRNREPASPVKQAIGLFFLAIGYFIIAVGVSGVEGSAKTSMFWLLSMYLVHTLGELCLSPIGLSMVARLAPLRLGSLLMGIWFMSNAMANDFAGMLSKLYPEKYVSVSLVMQEESKNKIVLLKRDKKDKTKLQAKIEKLEGNNCVPISSVSFSDIKDKKAQVSAYQNLTATAKVKEKQLFGIKINSLYSFFMVFVVMGGVAAIILYVMQKKLLSMMHGIR
ncbi:MAG: peptide MFS transporter [Flavobacteriales bacterium]